MYLYASSLQSQQIMLEDDSQRMGLACGLTAGPTTDWQFDAGMKGAEDPQLQLVCHCCCYYENRLSKQLIRVGNADYNERMGM